MKKKKLILLQPKKYNELFSTYHNSKKVNNYLPKIPSNLQKDLEIMSYTTKTNYLAHKGYLNNKSNLSSDKNSYILKRNSNFFNSLMTYQNSQENFKKHEFLPYPSLLQTYKKTDVKSRKKKKFEIKKSNFNVIYLNLSNEASKSNNEYSLEQIDKNEFVNEKIKEINILKKQKIKEILNKNEKVKIKNDFKIIKNIPVILINLFAEDIYNNINHKNNPDKINTNNQNKSKISNINKDYPNRICLNFDNINKTIYKNNTFFQFILNNVKRKIELMNDTNKSISILYVKNLINSELSELRKNIEDYLIENKQFTSNNISKISNYEITPSNTFRFKTNNSPTKNNDNNNNSGLLGSLIKSNIFSKRNYGSKKINFENNNLLKKNKEKLIFQNKEIIFSIHQNSSKGKMKSKNIKRINIPKILSKLKSLKNEKRGFEGGIDTEKKYLTSRYYFNTSPNKISSKNNIFNITKKEKKISHSFSEIFLKKNYPKASDCINEISNSIEKIFLKKKRKKKVIADKSDKMIQSENFSNDYKINRKNKNYYRYIEKDNIDNNVIRLKKDKDNEEEEDDYEFINEQNIITPKRSKEIFHVFSDNQEKKIKIKNEKMKNNYENIVLDMQSILQEKSKLSQTPKKTYYKEEIEKRKNKKLKTEPSSSLYDGQQSSENQAPNMIYFDKNKKRQIIDDINENEIQKQNQKRSKKKKNKRNKNQDLSSIKTSKASEKNIFKKYNNKNNLKYDDIQDNKIIKDNKMKTRKKKGKKKKINKKEIILNLINNNPNIINKEELIKKYINSNNDSIELDEEEDEENEDESYEEEDEEEEFEGEENGKGIKDNDFNKNAQIKQNNKNLAKKKRKNKNSELNEREQSDNKKIKKDKQLKLNLENISKEKPKVSEDRNIENEIIKRNNKTEILPINSTDIKTKDSYEVKKNKSEIDNLVINKNKTQSKRKSMVIKKNKNFKHDEDISIDEKKENFEDNSEYQELVKEMKKYNVTNKNDLYTMKHLTADKKEKPQKGGILQKDSDNSFFLLDDNINDIIKKNIPPSNVNINNYHKQEELKILNETMELDNLTEQEKSFILSEMLNLRNLIIKSKLINTEVRNKINSKRVSLYRLVNKYFLNSILKDIDNEKVERDKYSKKLKRLEKIQNFGIFTFKNLSILESKYVIPFLDQVERRRRELEEKENKKLREKIALEEFENYKKKIEKRKKSLLIYDNSYLFKKEKSKEFKLRKEVEDILNKEYDEFQSHQRIRETPRLMSLITKRKKFEKKKKFSKNKNANLKLKRFSMQDEEVHEEDNSQKLKELEELKEEELKEKKLKEFFERIRKLKNGEFKDFDEELNQLINEIMDKKDVISKNKENRMNSFIEQFQYNRMKNKSKNKYYNKGFNFISPVRFISDIQQ